MPLQHFPGEGTAKCAEPGCGNREIEGLEFCLHHVPGELLAEAEEITGFRRCSKCRFYAVAGTEPPLCKIHGANTGSHQRKLAAGRVVEGRITDRTAALVATHIDALASPPPIGNPLSELLELAAEAKAWKEAMRQVAAWLFSQQRIRSAHAKVGEQLRAEIVIYERAMDRLAHLLIQISKLGIEARLAQIEEAKAATVERALMAALEASGLDLTAQGTAREVLVRELRRAA